eukprot:111761_1
MADSDESKMDMFFVWSVGTLLAFTIGCMAALVSFITLLATVSEVFTVTLDATGGIASIRLSYLTYTFMMTFVFAVFAFLLRIHFHTKMTMQFVMEHKWEREMPTKGGMA